MAVDFRPLLNKKADDCKPMPPLPEGTYRGRITKHQFQTSRDKGTPYVEFTIQLMSAEDDIDPNLLVDAENNPIDLSRIMKNTRFFLTPNADYRLVEFIKTLGVKTAGMDLGELIPLTTDAVVLIPITQQMDRKDPTRIVNIVGDIVGA